LEPHLQEELGAGLVCYEKDSAAVEWTSEVKFVFS
jgi:hypothetical protein